VAEPELPTGALKLQVLENASMENTSTEKSRSHNVPLEILSELQQRHCAYSRITASQKRISLGSTGARSCVREVEETTDYTASASLL